jgi:Fe-S cluster assembly iron-binding protein IscA
MLTLTPIASEAIRQLSAQTDDPEATGIRIAPGPETPEGTALELTLVEEPEPTDEKIDEDGATVYLEPHVADPASARLCRHVRNTALRIRGFTRPRFG